MKAFPMIIISTLCVSCASVEKSTILGAVIGATVGGAIGNSAGNDGHRDQSTLVGAAVGAGIGSLIGYSAYQDKLKKEQQQQQQLPQLGPGGSKAPMLTAPKVRRVWVPATIEGDKYIDGHYMYVIEKTSGWSN